MDYFDQKNIEFFNFLNDTFDLNKTRDWKDISRSITLLKVKRTYRVFADLFPRKFDYINELKKSQNTFSSIHYGTLKGHSIIDEIVRFSLYSDQIIVFHPLQNPVITNQDISPSRDPKYWLPDFLQALYFYIVIQKWVRQGIVKLIINPYEYDFGLRDKIDKEAKERIGKLDFERIYKDNKSEITETLAEQFAISFRNNRNKEYIINSLKKVNSPRFTDDEALEFADAIMDAFPRVNPLYKDLQIPLNSPMVSTTKGGGPLESLVLVSEITGGNIYTPKQSTWNQIVESNKNDFWIKLNQTYSKIPMTFLNNVDTNFALEVRKEGRLIGVRQEMKKMFSELNSIDISKLSEQKMKDLHESFLEEVKKSEAEWKLIGKQAEIARTHWAATSIAGSVGVPIVTNNISLIPIAIGSAAWWYQNERNRSEGEKLFRVKNPISVFVDLRNQKQNYFSILKNCIF